MAVLKSPWKHWAKALVMGAALAAAPVWAGCDDKAGGMTARSAMLGEAVAPATRLTLTLATGATEGRGTEPLTLRRALLRDALSLRLVDVTVSDAEVSGFRVFLNAPEGADLTPKAPSFATSVAFFPTAEPGKSAGTFVIDLAQALEKGLLRDDLRGDAPVQVTLVPIGPEDAEIGLGGSELVMR